MSLLVTPSPQMTRTFIPHQFINTSSLIKETFSGDSNLGFEMNNFESSSGGGGDESLNASLNILYSLSPSGGGAELELPPELREMSFRSRNEVVAYCILFVIAATGNLTLFFSVCHQLAKLKWRITVLMLHLSIADLIVTFFLMPMEICWRIMIQWVGGELLCKVCQFFRAFGLYLSSNILICISLDRFIAIWFPLRMVGATRRVKGMILIAWLTAAISSAPQCVVFSVQVHPKYPSFKQCVSFGFFSNGTQEILYNVFSVSAMYFIPLIIIIFTYTMILCKISSKNKEHLKRQEKHHSRGGSGSGGGVSTEGGSGDGCKNCVRSRMIATQAGNSDAANLLARAKKRTLRMTFVIVIVFVFCWTPYAVITLWYMFDKEGAKRLDGSLQDILFMMAVANSCLNPIVYGNYTKKTAGQFCSCINFTTPGRRVSVQANGRFGNEDKRSSSLLALTSVI